MNLWDSPIARFGNGDGNDQRLKERGRLAHEQTNHRIPHPTETLELSFKERSWRVPRQTVAEASRLTILNSK